MFVTRIRKKQSVNRNSKKKPRPNPDTDKYIYLTPTEFVNLTPSQSHVMETMSTDITERASHYRRAHWRILKHERYGTNVGKRIYIKPIWVGISSKRVSNKNYKIVLDVDD